ncbi:MAG: tRNA 2-thiouridine(34) synthase MnmA [Ruminococcaceae bacterium]|nr:tRNA 2-thiouridine(34) synthase MnmA [Oscillospiraceae bacterium]
MKEKIFAAMSGGIDSSAVAWLLLEGGSCVSGVTMRLVDDTTADADIRDAAALCHQLGISHSVYDMRDEFARCVIDNFVSVYQDGGTPNPCIVCNKYLKFGALLDRAISEGADKIATGHYARIEKCGDRYLLRRAADSAKDQSYVLWMLSQHQLSRTVFPLGGLSKSEIRELASERDFVTAHKSDSQDICFVRDGDYAGFITHRTGKAPQSGDFTDIDGNILGRHKGIIYYTVGQRKGLGISFGQPMFVKDKDAATGRIVLSDNDSLFTKEVRLNTLNLIACDRLDGNIRAEVKIRYAHKAAPATLIQTAKDTATVIFDEPQRAPARGQSAVIYDGDTVIGGGIII